VPVRNRRPEDDKPLFRAVNGQQLMRPVGGGQEEPHGAGESQSTSQAEGAQQGGEGPIARAVGKAQENNWVYPSMADKAREKGLLEKADQILDRVKTQLGGR